MDYSFFKMSFEDLMESLPNVTCINCNWIGKSFQTVYVYEPLDNKTRKLHHMCPECNTIDVIKRIDKGYIPPVKIDNRKRRK